MDFVRDNPGKPVPEETFTHSHLSWSSIVPYLLHPSTTTHGILPVQSMQLTTGFVQTVKYCFPGLSRTCKDQIPGFSRTHKTRFQQLSGINLVHEHGCIRSKRCTYQISYQCNCITVNKPKCNNWNSNRPTHTHTTQPFYGSVEFVWENPGEPVPEETFTHYSHRSHQSSLSAFSI